MSFFHKNMKRDEERGEDAKGQGTEGSADAVERDAKEAALAELTRERDDYLARWQRAQADFQNLRRRTMSDIDAAVRRSQQSILEGMLLAIDQLDLALMAPRSGDAAQALARGVEMTRAELKRTLANAGVQPMSELKPGDRFDPALHQAVASVPSPGREPDTIIEVVRQGYSWGEFVLRPAHVLVASAAQNVPPAPQSEEAS